MTAPIQNVQLPDGRTVEVRLDSNIEKNTEVFQVRRGPYNFFVVVQDPDGEFKVRRPVYFEKRRPALLDPIQFISIEQFSQATSAGDLRSKV